MASLSIASTDMGARRVVEGVDFDPNLPPHRADGILWWYSPRPEMLSLGKPVFWYQCEGVSRSMFRTKLWKSLLKNKQVIFLHHHPSVRDEWVDPITHYEPWCANENSRREGIGAIASNAGGRLHWMRGERVRNRFNVHPLVQLFGPRDTWALWRKWPWSSPRLPANFSGEVSVSWYKRDIVEFLSGFHAVVSMENTATENYFSERFVNTVRAGAVPIYHAHPSVKANYLRGAAWIDPADFGFDADKTLTAAFRADRSVYAAANHRWLLDGAPALRTLESRVVEQIANAIKRRIVK